MTCRHISIQTKRYGGESTCASCRLDIIWTGAKWEWTLALDPKTVRKMRTQKAVDDLVEGRTPALPERVSLS